MASRADWMDAASCYEGPRPSAGFADLPREHRREMIVGALAAVLSTLFFLELGILLQPIPSRSLVAHVFLPNVTTPHRGLIDAPSDRSMEQMSRASMRNVVSQVPAVQRASVHAVWPHGTRTSGIRARQGVPRNLLSRFVHGLIHGAERVGSAAIP
jgi:hypothetical protein